MVSEVKTAEDLERIIAKAHEAQAVYATYSQEQAQSASNCCRAVPLALLPSKKQ